MTTLHPHSTMLATSLTAATRRSAFTCFPLTGSKPYKNRDMLQLERQRIALTRLLRTSRAMVHAAAPRHVRFPLCTQWWKQYAHCAEQLQLQWTLDALDNADPVQWIAETQHMLNQVRIAIRKERQQMQHKPIAALDANPAAAVHRMLDSSELPAQLHAVIDKHGALTASADELEDVLVEHYTSVFALPPPPAPIVPPPPDPPAMLLHKESVDPAWYDGLLAHITEAEILSVLADAPLISSPGQDEVSTGLWKIALQGSAPLCTLIAAAVHRLPAHFHLPRRMEDERHRAAAQGCAEGAQHEQRASHQPAELPGQAVQQDARSSPGQHLRSPSHPPPSAARLRQRRQHHQVHR